MRAQVTAKVFNSSRGPYKKVYVNRASSYSRVIIIELIKNFSILRAC